MQKTARGRIIVESLVPGVGTHHDRQRQITTRNAFRQTRENPVLCLLVHAQKKYRCGPATDSDLVADQVALDTCCTRRARARRKYSASYMTETARTLYQGLDNQCGEGCMLALQYPLQHCGVGAMRNIPCSFSFHGKPPIRRRYRADRPQQRRVGGTKRWHIGDRQGPPAFRRDNRLRGKGTFACQHNPHCANNDGSFSTRSRSRWRRQRRRNNAPSVLSVSAARRSESSTTGACAAAGEHYVFQCFHLLAQCGADTRIGVTKKIHPPGTDSVEITLPRRVVKPRPLPTRNGQQRRSLLLFHLRAGMPL